MMPRRYYMAHECPICKTKDEQGMWGGARMWSSEWQHGFSCCSDECGFSMKRIVDEKEKTKKGRKWLADLWHKLQSQSDARLTGEPYYGYDAEQQLRSLGRMK